MNRMRKCNDEVYQLAKVQALDKKLKNKRFRLYITLTNGGWGIVVVIVW
jgi:hypothetical protein